MLAAVALASLALVCHGQHAPLTPEQKRQGELEYYADARASFGFRSDIPYIEELIRRDRWEHDVGDFPATAAENRYLRLHDRLELGGRAYRYVRRMLRRRIPYTEAEQRYLDRRDALLSERADAYFRRHDDEYGGADLAGRFRTGPVLVVRFTRRLALHRRNLERLVDGRVRVVEARHTEEELRRIEARINDAASGGFVDGWGDDGILIRGTYAAVLRERFGPAVKPVRVGTRHEWSTE